MTHGVIVNERATDISVPISSPSAVQFIVGTAPVNMVDDPPVNEPIYVTKAGEACQQLGYCPDMRFTLCQSMYAMVNLYNVGPAIFVNVLDPAKHNKTFEPVTVPVDEYIARVPKTGIIKQSLTVTTAGDDPQKLTEGKDYTLSFDPSDGTLVVSLVATGAGATATSLTVAGKELDPSAVKNLDIIGGYDPNTGDETGLELIRRVYPKFGVVPSIALAPEYSADPLVGITLAAKMANINGVFKGVALVDLDTDECRKYTDVKELKEASGATSELCYPMWPKYRISDYIFSPSAIVGPLIASIDAANDSVPYMSPSNHALKITGTCLADGTEVVLDQDMGTTLNSFGVSTAINVNGWHQWGNYTGVYPASSDAKDIWLAVRRMFNWQGNNFIQTYFSKVDQPGNLRLIENIVNSENIRMSAYTPDKIASCVISYNPDDNPITSILAGELQLEQACAFYTPAQTIKNTLFYDTAALKAALSGGE